jgi:cytochrome c-type biogenesis protein CcmH/NrfG
MRRFRLSTLILLVAIAALLLTVVLQQRRIARLESDKATMDDVIKLLRMDKAQGWLVREGQGKTPRSRRLPAPEATGR